MGSLLRRSTVELRSYGNVLAAFAIVAVALVAASPSAYAVLGTCDTASAVEVEATAGVAGPTGYTTLQLAVAAVSTGVHQGVVNVEVCATTAETVTSTINASGTGGASYTSITIKPVGGAARTVSGAITSLPLIDFSGADNVTIDGLNTGGNSLTIANTNTGSTASTSTLRFIGDATSNTVTRTNIQGSGTSAIGTIAATILFSTGTTTGNDNNNINNCNIGPAGANLPSKAIMSSGTTTSLTTANSGIIIDSNNIFDFFLATGNTSGMNIVGGADIWTISNNRIYQTATRTFTSASRYAGITITTTSPGNGSFTITGNVIGFGAANGTGVTTITGVGNNVRGIVPSNVSTTVATSIQNNTISGINQTTSNALTTSGSSAFIAMALGESNGLFNVGNTTGNTIGSLDGSSTIVVNSTSTTAGTAPVIGIFDFSFQSSNISNNNIGSITIQSTGTTVGFRGILVSGTTGISATLLNNTIAGIVDTQVGIYAMYGIQTGTSIVTATNNTIRNFTGASTGGGTVVQGGILVTNTSTTATTISRNTIHSLFNASGAASTSTYAISASLGTASNVIQRNFIHSLSMTGTATTSQLWGILLSAGTTNVQNNMIRLGLDSSGTSITPGYSIIGIRDAGVAANYYFNSVYIGGSAVVSSSNTYGFLSTTTTVTRNFQNNIFWNARSNASGGIGNVSIGVGGTTANPAGLTSNYNDLYATGTDGVTGVFNSVIRVTLADWRTATGQDANSFAGDPQFINPIGTATAVAAVLNLHIHPSNPTPVEGSGLAIGAVTDDFDGDVRASFSPTDVGADAGNFVTLDISPPTISYTPFANTTLTTNRSLATTITDNTGVPTSGTGLPVIYYRKGTSGTYAATQCTSGGGSSYSCTIDYTQVTGGSVTTGDTVQYYVAAQDTNAPPNVTTNPSTGASGFTANPPAATTPTTAPASYVIVAGISGIKTVCASLCDYTSLTLAGGAFADINAKVVTASIELQIQGDLTGETGANALNQIAEEPSGSNFTVKIYPTGASAVEAVRTITGSSATSLITLNGADRVTIDGSNGGSGSSRLMTITNTNAGTSSAVIWLQSTGANGATSNTIKNLNIVGSGNAQTLFGIGSGSSTISTASTGAGNNSNTIQNNNVSKTQYAIFSQGLSAGSKNSGNVITQNLVNTASPDNVRRAGVLVGFENNIQITSNSISGMNSAVTAEDVFGISLGTTAISTSTFTGNEVTNAIISKNTIGSVVHTNTYSASGIFVAPATSGTTEISNNMISGVISNGTGGDISVGIFLGGGTGSTTNVWFNSVSMTGTTTGGTDKSIGLAVGGSNPIVDIRDNILYNTQNIGSASHYAIGLGYSTFTNLTSNNNDLFVTNGASYFVGFTGSLSSPTNQSTLSAWQTATGKDAASISANPVFVSTSDLHISKCVTSPVNNAGVFIAAVPVDYDGETRSNTTPDIGADEITPAIPCTDGNDCTDDTCNPSTGCAFPNTTAGTPCGSGSDTVCDNPDTCNGSGTCQANNEPGTTVCRADAGECDVAENCDGAGSCPADGFELPGTTCGSGSDTVCDNPDSCNAGGVCQSNNEPGTTICRADAGECDVAENCDGAGSCPADGFELPGTACGSGSDTVCDNPDTCNAGGVCQSNNEPGTTVCRADTGECDVAENCDGAGSCPVDGFELPGTFCGSSDDTVCDNPDTCNNSGVCQSNNEPGTTVCRADAGECDVAENCDGAGTCPVDGFEPSGTACGSDSDTVCDNPDACTSSGICESNNEPGTTVCRADAGECDVAENCDGAGSCPADGFELPGTFCGSGSDTVCDNPDTCNATGSCQSNNEPGTTVCRADAGECDVAESCDGAGSCPVDGFESSGTACGSNADTVCDNPDTCNAGGVCQSNNEPGTTVCRADAGDCDVAENCDGAGSCPVDGFESSGTACGSSADTDCDNPDTCNATGACLTHYEPSGAACSDGLACTTGDNCDGIGLCGHTGTVDCSSGSACTTGECVEPSGTCSFTGGTCTINGTVRYYRHNVGPVEPSTKGIPDEDVTRTSTIEATSSDTTDANGDYSFTNEGGDVTLTPAQIRLMTDEDECHNSITAADASEISKGSVGSVILTTNQRIAGDVSNSGQISSYDAALTAQKAVAAPCLSYIFPVRTATGSDWAFRPVTRSYTPLTGVGEDYSFLGVLFGDVTGNWTAPVLFGQSTDDKAQAPSLETALETTLAETSVRVPTTVLESGFATTTRVQSGTSGATIYVAGIPTKNTDGTYTMVFGLQHADGILGLDIVLKADPAVVQVRSIATTGISSAFTAAGHDSSTVKGYAISLYGVQALAGSGSFLKVTYTVTGSATGVPFNVAAQANEGGIPITWVGVPRATSNPLFDVDE